MHASCVRGQQAVINRFKDAVGTTRGSGQEDCVKDAAADTRGASSSSLPHGLSSKSLDDYSAEWGRYVRFASRSGDEIPGRDVQWDLQLVWDYLRHRATTCKPETVKQILTKLAHFGARCNFVLATSKFDGDPAMFRSVTKMKRQLAIDARKEAKQAGLTYEPVDRCTPVGCASVGMLLSAFRLTSEERFLELSRRDRHHIAAAMMQHTGGMRFGQFRDRKYTLEAFLVDARSASIRLVTDWSRYAGRRQFAIEFASSPRFQCMWYHVYAPNGDLIDSYPAATLLHWHFAQLRRAGERQVFAPVLGEECSREDRQAWLREVLLLALPVNERQARGAVEDVTPHSFRPGLAGDLFREGVSMQRTGSICRWNTPRVVRMYAERPCLAFFRLTNGFRLIERL